MPRSPKGKGKQPHILIVEDEPENISWVYEFLDANGIRFTTMPTLPEALNILGKTKFDLIIIDMNIPAIDAITAKMLERSPLVERFPGIAVAQYCRDHGYSGRTVMAHTVHDDELADQELRKIDCKYLIKGRPREFKAEIKKIFPASFSV